MRVPIYYETIQNCELVTPGTSLGDYKYNVLEVFKIIHQAKKEVFEDIDKEFEEDKLNPHEIMKKLRKTHLS